MPDSTTGSSLPPRGYDRWVFWILAAVILVLVMILLVLAATGNISATQVLIALALVVALLFLLPRVPDVVKVVVGKGGLTVELEGVKKAAADAQATAVEASDRAEIAAAQAGKATREAEEAREKLDRFIFRAMPKPTYANLVKLAGPRFGKYDVTENFKEQLRFLRDSGYITLDCYVSELRGGEDLSAHAQVTDLGREFIENRQRLIPNEQL
jgi:hypothetical protein